MTGLSPSKVRYARSGEIDIAYQMLGDGPTDLVFVAGFVSHLDLHWEIPSFASRIRGLAEHCRVVMFDKRGTGLSDRSLGFGSAAERMDDIRAVADAAGLERFAVLGISEGGPLALLFTATYPDRVTRMVLHGTFARGLWAPDYPAGRSEEEVEATLPQVRGAWGTGRVLRFFMGNAPDSALPMLARYERSACTPHMAEEVLRRNIAMDVRSILPTIGVPTLVMHSKGDPVLSVEHARYLAANIPGAQLVEVDSDVHNDWNRSEFFPEIPAFLGIDAGARPADRMLATVLFTDIVSSTEHDAKLGDRRWGELLDHHDRVARACVERYRGRLVKTTGDGVLATFDGPARGIQCAQTIAKDVHALGIDIRAGVHTGEIELRGDDISGLGVVIARRVCDLADTGELLTSRTVKDLVTGSGIGFADRGPHTLKGVPEEWQLYAVQG